MFLDCSDPACDYDFFRTEVNFVSYVRDRRDAQVYVLVVAQQTGAGGKEFRASFLGQQEFRRADDSLRYTSGPAESRDQTRRGLAQLLKRGLVRYVNHTPLAERIQIAYLAPSPLQQRPAAALRDPWKHWTFSTTVNGFFDGEQSTNAMNLSGSLTANRTTEAWKVVTSLQNRYNQSRIDVGEETVTAIQRAYALNSLIVMSLSDRWSFGSRADLTSSNFLNQRRALRIGPAVEYNVFPYSESARRQFTFQYSMGATSFNYREETIFGKTSESLVDQRLLMSLRLLQPWGSATTSLEGSHYLEDPSKRRGILSTSIDLSLSRGLSLVTFGGVELVRDQLYLPKQGASREELLLRQRQLATSFRYYGSLGIGYTFGSRFANIVNPRFMGSSGGASTGQ